MKAVIWASDMLTFPTLGRGLICVWHRHLKVFCNSFLSSILLLSAAPAAYLAGIGYGLGSFVGSIDGVPYLQFFAPSVLVIAGIMNSFYECTYGTSEKQFKNHVVDTFLLAPISARDVVMGEISWAALKSLIGVMPVILYSTFLGIISLQYIVPMVFVLFLTFWLFAALGMLVSSYDQSLSTFVYFETILIIPMTLFCGTYYSLDFYNSILKNILYLFPVTHSVLAVRGLALEQIQSEIYLNILYILLGTVILTNIAVARMERRIID